MSRGSRDRNSTRMPALHVNPVISKNPKGPWEVTEPQLAHLQIVRFHSQGGFENQHEIRCETFRKRKVAVAVVTVVASIRTKAEALIFLVALMRTVAFCSYMLATGIAQLSQLVKSLGCTWEFHTSKRQRLLPRRVIHFHTAGKQFEATTCRTPKKCCF